MEIVVREAGGWYATRKQSHSNETPVLDLCATDKKAAQWNRRLAAGCTEGRRGNAIWITNMIHLPFLHPGSAGKILAEPKNRASDSVRRPLYKKNAGDFSFSLVWRFLQHPGTGDWIWFPTF